MQQKKRLHLHSILHARSYGNSHMQVCASLCTPDLIYIRLPSPSGCSSHRLKNTLRYTFRFVVMRLLNEKSKLNNYDPLKGNSRIQTIEIIERVSCSFWVGNESDEAT